MNTMHDEQKIITMQNNAVHLCQNKGELSLPKPPPNKTRKGIIDRTSSPKIVTAGSGKGGPRGLLDQRARGGGAGCSKWDHSHPSPDDLGSVSPGLRHPQGVGSNKSDNCPVLWHYSNNQGRSLEWFTPRKEKAKPDRN